ncbi:hypothetical protein BVY03_01840 [bacterium K02(2017)]|nr:hypothetical protein BVY03_01840 [bacterium K02(2017)]
MKSFWSCLLFLLIFSPSVFAISISTPEQKKAMQIQKAIFQRSYSRAVQILNSMDVKPDSPLPSLVKMSLSQFKMLENFKFNRQGEFNAASKIHETKCESLIENSKTSVWYLMLCGAGDGLRALHYMKNGKSFKAISYAKKTLKLFKKVKKLDPQNVDVELGFGIYAFFKSEYFETKLSFIPFIKDNREQALARIKKVSQQGVYGRYLADLALGLIALETERRQLGQHAFKKLNSQFPGNVLFKLMHGAFLIKIQEYSSALGILYPVEKKYSRISAAKYFIGRCLALQGKDYAKAKDYLEAFLLTKPSAQLKGPAHYLLGLVAEKQGHIDEALTHYQKGHDIFPKYKKSLKSLLRLRKKKS